MRPDFGAFLGAVAVLLAFAYFARAVNWIGDPAIASGWTDQAAQFGIVAVPVALLMIGGEFDLSAGVMIGSSGLLLGYLATYADMNIWPAMAIVIALRARDRLHQRHPRGQDEAAELHRHARDVLRPPGRQRRPHAETHRHDRDPDIDPASGYATARRLFASDLTQYDYKVEGAVVDRAHARRRVAARQDALRQLDLRRRRRPGRGAEHRRPGRRGRRSRSS